MAAITSTEYRTILTTLFMSIGQLRQFRPNGPKFNGPH
jgi:hypothetical protein